MSRYLIQRIVGNPSIELLYNSELTDLEGENGLEEVSWINKQTGGGFGTGPSSLHHDRRLAQHRLAARLRRSR